jgi:2-C-methyl-D-erythritol 4-phosphate cytidylyltransferase
VSALNFAALVVAAGRGTRFGRPKQLVDIAGKPMLWWSLRTFAQMQEVAQIVVVTETEWLEEVRAVAADAAGNKLGDVAGGGATRRCSTYNGLQALVRQAHRRPDDAALEGVFVHDGARPLVTAEDVRHGMQPVRPGHGALLAIPVVDTIKAVGEDHLVQKTLDRKLLWAAQTPQFAMFADMLAAHEAGARDALDATDDAMLLELAGVSVHVVRGSPENFKVTLSEDHARAEYAMRQRVACE